MALHAIVSPPVSKRNSTTKKHLNPAEAAAYLNVGMNTMAQWRMKKKGPPYSRLNGFLIRYSIDDLEAYVTAKRVNHGEK